MAKDSAHAFAAALEQLRIARGLTPAELARALDVDATVVSRWRRGLVTPGIDRIRQIAAYFGVDPATLERLAGYRANTAAGMQDATIAPNISALLDDDRAQLLDLLRGINPVWHKAILDAQRYARNAAASHAEDMERISKALNEELAPPERQAGATGEGEDSAANEHLTQLYPASEKISHPTTARRALGAPAFV